ncbi:MAG: hypothetical protein ACRENE_19345 [Polyangiaceae bacterium]
MTKEQCINADSSAQDLRRTGKFSSARDNLRRCSDPSCPAIIRDDCTQQLDELRKAQPTIVFDVKDGAGRDLADVTATIDGVPVGHPIDGSPLSPDPGSHVLVFSEPGQPAVTQTFVLREGEKDRHERIVVGPPPQATKTVPAVARENAGTAPTSPNPATGMPAQKVLGLVAGGVGAAGLVAGAVFGAMTMSAASQQKSDCASPTNCPNPSHAASEHSSGETTATLSTVGFVAGGVLAAAGAVLYLTSPRSKEVSATSALAVVPSLAPGGGGLSVSGGF